MDEEETITEEEKTTTKVYFYHCSRCNADSKSKQKFVVHSINMRRGMILRCEDCGKLITRKVDTKGEPLIRKKKKTREYSEEEISFLKEQFTHTFTTRKELIKMFNEKFNVSMAYSTLGMVLTRNKILKDKKFHRSIARFYDEEEIDFLRQHYEHTDTTREELKQLFNENFKLDKSVSAILHILKKHNIIKDEEHRKESAKKYQRRAESIYTKEHADFIRENYTEDLSIARKSFLKLFNKHFSMDITIFQLGYIMNRYDLRRERTGRALIYTPEVKQFMKKCVEDGLTKQECKDECEKKFERHFNRQSIGQVVNKMGLNFKIPSAIEIDSFFEEYEEIEEFIKKVVNKNLKCTYHSILIRDAIIEKYEKNIKVLDICTFCEMKNIKINHVGKTRKEKAEKQRERTQTHKYRKQLASSFDNMDGIEDV